MTPARILIVEDARIVARDIEQQLKRIGHTVAGIAGTAEEALNLARSTAPDLVLMDIRLSGAVDGIEVAERLRRHHQIPTVFLTAYADDDTVRRATHAEPFGYLLKPFEDTQLRTTVEMALYKHAAERRLHESERRYVATLSSIGDAVIATDAVTIVTFMNPVAEKLTGWPRAQAIGVPLAEVFRAVREDSREPIEHPASTVLEHGEATSAANRALLLCRDGRELPIDGSEAPILDEEGAVIGTVLVFRDTSERRRLEETLRRAQADVARVSRLTTMGELAASIAHEVNQPLMAIVTNAGLALRYAQEAAEAAERIVRDGRRAGEIVHTIRGMVSQAGDAKDVVDLNEIVSETLAIASKEASASHVLLETAIHPQSLLLNGNRVQLRQVIFNLVTNAMEALAQAEAEPRVVRITTMPGESGDVRLMVEDNGPGVSDEIADRIFEALFTTKREGMGMGLAICRSVITAHGGKIWLNRDERRTTFGFAVPSTNERDKSTAQ